MDNMDIPSVSLFIGPYSTTLNVLKQSTFILFVIKM